MLLTLAHCSHVVALRTHCVNAHHLCPSLTFDWLYRINPLVWSERIDRISSSSTPFIGRHRELAEVAERLADPACRLLTLTGPGGIGKSRLAIRAATDARPSFAHGVAVVALQQIRSAEFLTIAMADALRLPLAPSSDQHVQLRAYLSDKAILLLLDNFEHLLRHGSVEILPDLLNAAPALKLLVTSREPLQLRHEWRFPVKGMPVPSSAEGDDVARYDLVQLFVECARRVRNDFSLAAEQAGVVRVCQLMEGVPLAVELAASWADMLHCETIAAELGHDLQMLHTTMRDVPERHRSMRTVFDHSWKLLSSEERSVFQCLAVFSGGFGREAAEQIAGATLDILATLTRQSLLYLTPAGRYQMHELLRQYADDRLAQTSPDAVIHTRDLHCVYYTTFLREHNAAMNGGQQLHAVREIAAELDNIRAAWHWAIERRNIAALVSGANALFLFCQYRSRYLDGIQFFEQAAQLLNDTVLVEHRGASLLLYQLGWLYVRLGRLEDAQAAFAHGLAAYHHDCDASRSAHASDPRLGLGLLASLQGDYAHAQHLLDQVCDLSKRDGHLGNQQTADYFLAGLYLAQGQYQAAHEHAQAAYVVAKASHDHWFMAFCHNELGQVARALGDYEQATRQYQASYALRDAFGDTGGMAIALIHVGGTAMLQGNFEAAEAYYRQGLALYRDINDQGGLVAALDGLGQACCARGQVETTAQHFSAALEIVATTHFIVLRLSLLTSIGQLLLQTRYQDRGLAVLTLVRHHAAATDAARSRAEHLLRSYRSRNARYAAEQGQEHDLDVLTRSIQEDLVALVAQHDPSAPTTPPQWPTSQAPNELLTERERELLVLLAAGHSYQEIAAHLTIAVGTVKSHAHNIYAKLGVRNRVQAAARAAMLELL